MNAFTKHEPPPTTLPNAVIVLNAVWTFALIVWNAITVRAAVTVSVKNILGANESRSSLTYASFLTHLVRRESATKLQGRQPNLFLELAYRWPFFLRQSPRYQYFNFF